MQHRHWQRHTRTQTHRHTDTHTHTHTHTNTHTVTACFGRIHLGCRFTCQKFCTRTPAGQELRNRLGAGLTEKWTEQSGQWRRDLGVLPDYFPYTKDMNWQKAGVGLSAPKRLRDLMELSVLQSAKRARTSIHGVQPALSELLLDVSQSHKRRPMPGLEGPSRCLTTSSRLWCFAQKRLLCGAEHLLLQGLAPSELTIPDSLTEADLREISGEGIALPCLATIVWALGLALKFFHHDPFLVDSSQGFASSSDGANSIGTLFAAGCKP